LRPWTLRVKLFEGKDAADLWMAEGAGGCEAGAPPAPPAHSFDEGSLVRTLSPAGDSLFDLSNTNCAASFFIAVKNSVCAAGVRVQGVALTADAQLDEDLVITKRRRLVARTGAVACATVDPQTTAAATAVRVGAAYDTPPTLAGGVGPALRRGKRGLTRPVVSWSYEGPGSAAKGSEADYRSPFLKVATPPTDFLLPVGLTGYARRTCELLLGGASVFLTGPPGSGKTHMANEVISVLRDTGLSVTACGSSGVAAALVHGTTVHSWAGFINGDADLASPLNVVLHKVIPMAAKVRMCAAMALVVDEVGTLSAALVNRLDLVLRAVRQRASPFGGLSVLFVGDFLQLAPPKGQYAFLSDVWRVVFGDRAVVLSEHWRHVRDGNLLGLLLRLRTGTHTSEDIDMLATRRSLSPPPHVLWLFCHTLDVLEKNTEELQRLPGTPVEYVAVDKAMAPYLTISKASALMDTSIKYVRVLSLRVGAMVAVPTACLAAEGVPCGLRGVVLSFSRVGAYVFPRVRFSVSCGGSKTVVVLPATAHAVALDGWSKAATRTQVPLVLSWAATIHAAQGWTLPEVAIDLSKAFAAGQALSGLSRTPTLEGLHLVGFDESKIVVDSAALAFHEGLVPY